MSTFTNADKLNISTKYIYSIHVYGKVKYNNNDDNKMIELVELHNFINATVAPEQGM